MMPGTGTAPGMWERAERFVGNPLREESELFCRFTDAGKKVLFAPDFGLV